MTSIPTERLLLEPLNRIHAEEMFPVLSDPAIYDWLDYGAPSSVEALQTRYARLEAGHSPDGSEVWLNFLVRLNGGQAIGDVQATVYPGQKTYVGYVLASAYWGKGYAAEAMTALLAHLAQEHPTPVTLAVIEVENTRSAALLRRLNFSAALAGHSSATGLTASERLYVRYPDEHAARRIGTLAVGSASREDAGVPVISDFQMNLLDDLVVMWRESFEDGVGIIDPHPLPEQRDYFLSQVLPKHTVKVALLDCRLVGFVAASTDTVAQLHVRVGYFRQGIGSQLLAWAKVQSGGSLWLYTFARNHRARQFYEHHDFSAVAFGFEPTWKLDDVRYEWQRRSEESV
jgi:RimJ/RimL family protein N-acetyltransferase